MAQKVIKTRTGAGWEIIQRGTFDYSDYMEGNLLDQKKCPRELKVNIIIPGIKEATEIDLDVFKKEVRIVASIHNFSIPLQFPVDGEKAKASWEAPILTLELPVIPPKVTRAKFHVEESIDDVDEAYTAPPEPVPEPEPAPISDGTVHEAKFSMFVVEKVVTISLFVPKVDPASIRYEEPVLAFKNTRGQEYQCTLAPPFPLKSIPIVNANAVSCTVRFLEEEEETVTPHEEEDIQEVGEDLICNLIYELE